MEEIDLNQLLNYFKSKVVYIIFTMALAFALAALYVYFIRIPVYTSSTTILLNQKDAQATINYNDLSLNKSLVPTYSEIIKSKRVLNQVIDNMALEYEYMTLHSMIGVSEVKDTSIIRISVTNEDRELAARIANEISNVFTREVVEIYNLENISVIDEAEVSQVSSNTSIVKIVLIATIAGGLLASVAVFIIFYFDTTIKNEEDIERATGLPVIGLIPMPHEKLKKSNHKMYYQDIAKKHLSDTRETLAPIEVTKEIVDDNTLVNQLGNDDHIQIDSFGQYNGGTSSNLISRVITDNNIVEDVSNSKIFINPEEPKEESIDDLRKEMFENLNNNNNNNNNANSGIDKVIAANVPRRKKHKKRKIKVD